MVLYALGPQGNSAEGRQDKVMLGMKLLVLVYADTVVQAMMYLELFQKIPNMINSN